MSYLDLIQECTPVCPFVQEYAHTSAPEDLQARGPCALGALQPNETLAYFTLCLLCSKAFDRTVSALQRCQVHNHPVVHDLMDRVQCIMAALKAFERFVRVLQRCQCITTGSSMT